MIRIRSIFSTALPRDRESIEQVKEIFRQHFTLIADYADKIPMLFEKPFEVGYATTLLVSETLTGKVSGFSLLLHFPEINSTLLDFLAVSGAIRGGGLGGALYEASREYCQQIKSRGLYMEVLSDEPVHNTDPAILKENQRRMAFYEQYGLRPIIGTDYEEPVDNSNYPPPSLLFDNLGSPKPLRRSEARSAVRLMLKRKYSHLVDQAYIERVVESFVDDPIRFREPRYTKKEISTPEVKTQRLARNFAMIFNEKHFIHHVHDRGYVERPARVSALLDGVRETGLFSEVPPKHFSEKLILDVHDRDFVTYLDMVCRKLNTKNPVYPYVFPIRRPDRKPRDLAVRAGYYCIDTFTPLDGNAYEAARDAVDVVMTGAEEVLSGRHVAYAMCRPPGHHAGRRTFGGFCYFSNSAIAAQYFSRSGKVAVLDLDYHHGNGTQDIFYNRDDVLTVSIHGHPNDAYPYFSGFADETGEGPGKGFNRNLPLPEGADEKMYLAALDKAIGLIRKFRPTFLVVSLGFDIIKGDPTGGFLLTPGTLKTIGTRLGDLHLPTLVVQEGGYSLRNLKRGAAAFFSGIALSLTPRPKHTQKESHHDTHDRNDIRSANRLPR